MPVGFFSTSTSNNANEYVFAFVALFVFLILTADDPGSDLWYKLSLRFKHYIPSLVFHYLLLFYPEDPSVMKLL